MIQRVRLPGLYRTLPTHLREEYGKSYVNYNHPEYQVLDEQHEIENNVIVCAIDFPFARQLSQEREKRQAEKNKRRRKKKR